MPVTDTTVRSTASGADGEPKSARRFFGLGWQTWLGIAAVCLAGFLLHRTLSNYSYDEIVGSVTSVPLARLGGALAFAAGSYLCLTLFDYLAVRYAGHALPWRKCALASFSSLSLGHSIGFAGLSSGAIRYRFYSRWGLDVGDVARVVAFSGATVAIGMATLGGGALLWRSDLGTELTGIGQGGILAIGAALLAAVGAYLAASAMVRAPLTIRRWTVKMPPLKLALAQVGVGALNFALVAGCLHQAILGFSDVPYVTVAAAFVVANTAALIAHVPGGLGVIEATVIHLIPGQGLIGAVLIFRVVYYLAPLPIGAATLALCEAFVKRKSS
jgi:uncharacterized membrane protein YbhN (UPF0104 family)